MKASAHLHKKIMDHFNERQKRIYAAGLAKEYGYGGMSKVHKELGMDIHTISRGMRKTQL
jgi:hypothetical protein